MTSLNSFGDFDARERRFLRYYHDVTELCNSGNPSKVEEGVRRGIAYLKSLDAIPHLPDEFGDERWSGIEKNMKDGEARGFEGWGFGSTVLHLFAELGAVVELALLLEHLR